MLDDYPPLPERITSYCALGDSFSEGLNDPAPGDDPEQLDLFRGWADRLAEHLTQSPIGSPRLRYANLAIRGRLLAAIVEEQLPRALELKPDLVSLIGGGNDCIRPKADVDALSSLLEEAVASLRKAGIRVLLGTGFDTKHMPVFKAVRGRIGIYNANIWSIAQRHGADVLNLWAIRELQGATHWSQDRLHLTSSGHALVADEALAVLEGRPLPSHGHPIPPRPPRPVRQAVAEESRWVREHLAPWVGRRIRGVSSGDFRQPKLPQLSFVDPAGAGSSPAGDGDQDGTGSAGQTQTD